MQEYSVIYEDSSILIIDKPQGLATTPGIKENLCNLIFKDFPELSKVKGYKKNEGGLLNRLDNETGGLILFAKTNDAFKYYSLQMKKEKIIKNYITIVQGLPDKKKGIINVPIAHDHKKKKRMTLVLEQNEYRGIPRNAETKWEVIKTNKKFSMVNVVIKKGARHQIRLHMAYNKTPIVGDKLYNKNNTTDTPYMLLYANKVTFYSNENKKIDIKTDLPENFLNFIK